MLLQTTYPLLKASTPTPKFIAIGSGSGTLELGAAYPLGVVAYGSSKAALNYFCLKTHFEIPGLGESPNLYSSPSILTLLPLPVCFSISPGVVQTDLREFAIRYS